MLEHLVAEVKHAADTCLNLIKNRHTNQQLYSKRQRCFFKNVDFFQQFYMTIRLEKLQNEEQPQSDEKRLLGMIP